MKKSSALRQKLHSQRGASLVITLLFFLLCLMVAAVTLTAASASVGRTVKQRKEQQAYLSVSSAGELLQREIEAMDRYAALNKAQASLAASESRLTEMNQLVTGYDRVASEYHRYSGDYLTDAQKQLVDRLDLLDLLQTRMAGVATLKSVSIVDNDMVVEISASSLKQVSDLRLALLQEAKVQSVTVYTATTGQTTSDGTVSASLVIHVAQEGTAGEASK